MKLVFKPDNQAKHTAEGAKIHQEVVNGNAGMKASVDTQKWDIQEEEISFYLPGKAHNTPAQYEQRPVVVCPVVRD